MWTLAQILTEITGKPRMKVTPGIDFTWANNLWTNNIFRVYEMIFWRRVGIRPEISYVVEGGKSYQYAHSFEGSVALSEVAFRAFLSSVFQFRLKMPRIYVPVLRISTGLPILTSPYLFAVAFDATSYYEDDTGNVHPTAPTTGNATQTITGSNILFLIGWDINSVNGHTTLTAVWNTSESLAQVSTEQTFGTNNGVQMWGKTGASTGTHTSLITASLSGHLSRFRGISYSGVSQSGFPDSSAKGTGTGTAVTATTTVVASNCWLVAIEDNDANTVTAGTNTTLRDTGNSTVVVFGDSNGTVGTGSQSLNFTIATSGHWGVVIASFATAGGGAVTTTTPMLASMGVGQ